ncbi:hypothetical protein EMCRGX_G012148 [Ephydatia muelleri]
MDTPSLMVVILHFHLIESSKQSLPCHTASGDNCTSSICPNTVVTYTCTITSGTAAGYTDWTLPTGTCPSNSFPNKIRLSQLVTGLCSPQGTGVPSMCGPYRGSSIQSFDPTYCLSSILTVKITAAMNGSTMTCSNTNVANSSITTVVSSTTIYVIVPPRPARITAWAPPVTSPPDQLTVTWTPPTTGGAPTSYNVTINDSSSPVVIADNGSSVYTHTFPGLVSDTLYTVSVVAINCAGASNGTSETTVINTSINGSAINDSSYETRLMVVRCSFNQSFYCVVCCSTDPSVPPDSSVYNISTTRGTEVTVSLQGLTSGQMYYCKAAATSTNSNNCTGVKVFFSFMTYSVPQSNLSNPGTSSHLPAIDISTVVGITFSITFIMAFSLGVLVTICISCISKTRSKTTSPHPSTPNATYEVVGIRQKKIDTIELKSNDAYGTIK